MNTSAYHGRSKSWKSSKVGVTTNTFTEAHVLLGRVYKEIEILLPAA